MTPSTPQKRPKAESSDGAPLPEGGDASALLSVQTPDKKPSKRAKPAPSPGGRTEKNPWTSEEEKALLNAVFDSALSRIPEIHEKAGLKGARTNPSVNTKLRSLKKKLTGSD